MKLQKSAEPSAEYDPARSTRLKCRFRLRTFRGGILGAKVPHPFHDGWRVFWTQQHGDNVTWEILPASGDCSAR